MKADSLSSPETDGMRRPRVLLFYSVTQSTMNKLQNNLARVVCDVGWRHASPLN